MKNWDDKNLLLYGEVLYYVEGFVEGCRCYWERYWVILVVFGNYIGNIWWIVCCLCEKWRGSE